MLKEGILLTLIAAAGCTSLERSSTEKSREEYYVLRGANFHRDGDRLAALREYEKALQKNSKNLTPLKEIALIYSELGEHKKAIEYYQKTLKLDSKDQVSIKNLAYIHYLQGDTEKSKEYLQKISRDKLDEFALKIEGYLYFKDKQYEKSYEKFLETNKYSTVFDAEYYKIFSENLKFLSKEKELEKLLEKDYEKFFKDREFIILYCKTLGENFNKWEKANKALRNYLINMDTDHELYQLLAYTYDRLGMPEKSMMALKLTI